MTLDLASNAAGPAVAESVRMTLRGIRKSFSETVALDALDLDLVTGEILGIAGPNGAGKSTLVRILAGEETRDGGQIRVGGQDWEPGDVHDPVAVVHQEPQLWPNLTLAENLMVGREPGRLAMPALQEADRAILVDLDIARFADLELADCSLAVRQRTEIARALARDARFFLFDEPNSALTEEESDQLFRSMRDLATRGRVVILVTHRLAELVAHCQRVAVIRDGRVRAELHGADITQERVARELVVGHLATDHPAEPADRVADGGAPAEGGSISVASWSHDESAFVDVDLEDRPGEILALVGVEGSGARELTMSLAGYAPATGTIRSGEPGRAARAVGPRGSGDPGWGRWTAYLSADRRGMLFPGLSVGQNLVIRLGRPDIAGPGGVLRLGRLRRLARQLVDRYRIRTASTETPLTALSGGNQQKVAIAAAIARRPRLLVLEEPTRGVDIGSKSEIYRTLRGYAAMGHAVVTYCTEVPEVYQLADRVAIMDGGRLGAPIRVADAGSIADLAELIARGEHTETGAVRRERGGTAPRAKRRGVVRPW